MMGKGIYKVNMYSVAKSSKSFYSVNSSDPTWKIKAELSQNIVRGCALPVSKIAGHLVKSVANSALSPRLPNDRR